MTDCQNVMITSCRTNQKPTLIAFTLAKTEGKGQITKVGKSPKKPMKVEQTFYIPHDEFKLGLKLKRMPRNDIIAIMGYTDIVLVHFTKEKMQFQQYYIFEFLHKDFITDAVFSGDCIFTVSEKDYYLHRIEFAPEGVIAE